MNNKVIPDMKKLLINKVEQYNLNDHRTISQLQNKLVGSNFNTESASMIKFYLYRTGHRIIKIQTL